MKTEPASTEEKLLTDKKLAARWDMSPQTLRNLRVSGGCIPYILIGRLVRYRLSDVLAWENLNIRDSTSDRGGAK